MFMRCTDVINSVTKFLAQQSMNEYRYVIVNVLAQHNIVDLQKYYVANRSRRV